MILILLKATEFGYITMTSFFREDGISGSSFSLILNGTVGLWVDIQSAGE